MGIVFYNRALKDLRNESREIQEKLLILIQALSDGAILTMPVSRTMAGFAGLKELRVHDSKGIVRVFYFIQMQNKILILHLYRKKSQKAPQHEIKTAIQRLKRMKEDLYES